MPQLKTQTQLVINEDEYRAGARLMRLQVSPELARACIKVLLDDTTTYNAIGVDPAFEQEGIEPTWVNAQDCGTIFKGTLIGAAMRDDHFGSCVEVVMRPDWREREPKVEPRDLNDTLVTEASWCLRRLLTAAREVSK